MAQYLDPVVVAYAALALASFAVAVALRVSWTSALALGEARRLSAACVALELRLGKIESPPPPVAISAPARDETPSWAATVRAIDEARRAHAGDVA